MVQSASIVGGPLGYQGVQTLRTSDRTTAIAAVLGLHAAVVGVFFVAGMRPAPPPPESTLSVSFISEAAASAAPTPPQPPTPAPPTPAPRLMATATPTPSPMTAPPLERMTQPQAPAPPAPPAPAATPSPAAEAPAAVTPPSFSAAYLNNPVVYPMSSRRKREQGVVRLRVQVSPEGAPLQVLLERTSGHSDLDVAALDVVKKRWRFAPAKQGDRAVVAWVIVPLEFSLDR